MADAVTSERIYHIARARDWEESRARGRYEVSTLGRTLADEGFIHCSRADQVDEVARAFYADVDEPLVLLVVDPARLTSPVRDDPVGDDVFPHVYGPIDVAAVVATRPLAVPR